MLLEKYECLYQNEGEYEKYLQKSTDNLNNSKVLQIMWERYSKLFSEFNLSIVHSTKINIIYYLLV